MYACIYFIVGFVVCFLLGVWFSFIFIQWYFFLSFACLCMIGFHCCVLVICFVLGMLLSSYSLGVVVSSFFVICLIVYDCMLSWFVYFVIFVHAVVILFPLWVFLFIQLKECILLHFLYLGFLCQHAVSVLFPCASFHSPNQMNSFCCSVCNLLCFVLGELLSSLSIHSSFVY